MKIIHDPASLPVSLGNTDETGLYCATIGFFDGVHRGHRFLLNQVKTAAKNRSLQTLVVTFAQHPRETLQTDYRPLLLTTPEEKVHLLESNKVDACAVLHFSKEMAALSAYEFMKYYLYDYLGVRCLVIGYDHRFGHNRNEGFPEYRTYGKEIGIEVIQAEPLKNDDFTVSSSVVRRFLEAGKVEMAAKCLNRPYHLSGTVIEGRQMGRDLGFPTANLQPEHPYLLIPARGVYAIYAEVDGKRYPAMLNIGRRPTLNNGSDCSIESHLFGFNGNLYGKTITLYFQEHLRDEHKFNSLDELKEQLRKDAEQTLNVLKSC